MAQYPYLVRPDVTVFSAAASPRTLRFLLGALAAGAVFLFPAIFFLLRVFKWEAISGMSRRRGFPGREDTDRHAPRKRGG
jgi:cytochrome d ubiquinol oxidase subunit II